MNMSNVKGFIVSIVASGLLLACASDKPKQSDVLNLALGKTDVLPQWSSGFSAGKFDELTLGFPLDPQLKKLIQDAIVNNIDIRMARARVDQSRGVLSAISGTRLPNVGLGGQLGTSTIPTATSGISGAGLIANWEIDVWGRIASASGASQSRVEASELDRVYVQQVVAANVIKSWIAISEAKQQVALSESLLDYANKQNQYLAQGERVGRNSAQDVSINAASIDLYQNQLITNQYQLNQAKRAMEILLGRYPAAQIDASNIFPNPITEIPAGIPSEIIARRPDVLAAQERYNAAFYDVEEAKKARLPSLKITGGVGYIQDSAITLSSGISNPISSLTGSIFVPLFMGGQLKANQDIKTAKQEEVLGQYAKASLNALSEVEATLDNDLKLKNRQSALASQTNHMAKSVEYEQQKYRLGKSDQFQVLQQEIMLANTKSNLIKISADRLRNRVDLHQSLGGHFIEDVAR
jgi:NodT family efflux transporter outer membrane factor (OMF) lipoprotein